MQIPARRFFNLLSVYEILLDDNRFPILCLRPWNTKTFCSRLQQHCPNDMLHIPIQPQWRCRSADKCISFSFSNFPEEAKENFGVNLWWKRGWRGIWTLLIHPTCFQNCQADKVRTTTKKVNYSHIQFLELLNFRM